jgi:hypothetical protein
MAISCSLKSIGFKAIAWFLMTTESAGGDVYGVSLISRGTPGLGCHAAVLEGISMVCEYVCVGT